MNLISRLSARPTALHAVLTLTVVVLSTGSVWSAPEASCTMTNVTSTASWSFQAGFVSGEGIVTFFNPATDCAPSPYPYEVTSFWFMLGGSTATVSIDIVVYDAASATDSCAGPGTELYRTTIQATGSNTVPQMYDFTPGAVCVDGPFFIGLEFHHSGLPGPGRQATSPPTAAPCENYIWTGGSWFDARSFGMNYYPAYWVMGQTGQCRETGACCDVFGECSLTTQTACQDLGGTYSGDGTDCAPNPCTSAFDCAMTEVTVGDSWSYMAGFVAGEGIYTYYNPAVECGSSPYPFELGAFRFMFGGSTATQEVDVVVYDLIPAGDSCDGPGAELYRFTTTATGNNTAPGVFMFPDGQCCVDGPFFIGLEFKHSGLPGSGREVGGAAAAACMNWIRTQPTGGLFDAIAMGVTSYPGFWVYGNPVSPCRAPGACCDAFDMCSISTQAECEAAGGTYSGDGTDCDPNPCGPGGNCAMTNVTSTASWSFQAGFMSGEGIYTFFNPAEDCGTPAYPYEISAFQFMFGGSTSTVNVDIVVFAPTIEGDSCSGPGAELFRTTVQVQGSNSAPQQKTFAPGELCVDGPFFMGLQVSQNGVPGPARQSDNPPLADRCENYIYSSGGFTDAINFGFVYYPAFWVFGQTGQCQTSCCVGRVGDANGSGEDMPTIGDISVMIDAKFITGECIGDGPGANIRCLGEADVNLSGGASPTCEDITIGDISMLIDDLFITGEPPFARNECAQ